MLVQRPFGYRRLARDPSDTGGVDAFEVEQLDAAFRRASAPHDPRDGPVSVSL